MSSVDWLNSSPRTGAAPSLPRILRRGHRLVIRRLTRRFVEICALAGLLGLGGVAVAHALGPPVTKPAGNTYNFMTETPSDPALGAPDHVAAEPTGPFTAHVSWASTDAHTNAFGVYRDSVLVATSTESQFDDPTLDADTTYTYAIAGIADSGRRSALSEPARVRTPIAPTGTPGRPTDLVAALKGPNSVALTWSAPERSPAFVRYAIYRNDSRPIASTHGLEATLVDTGLHPGASYAYWVTAVNASNRESQPSLVVQINIPSVPADQTTPSAPERLRADTTAACGAIQLTWDAATDNVGVVSYDVQRNAIWRVSVSGLTYTDTEVTITDLYTYVVIAYDAAGNHSSPSTPLTVRPGPPAACKTAARL